MFETKTNWSGCGGGGEEKELSTWAWAIERVNKAQSLLLLFILVLAQWGVNVWKNCHGRADNPSERWDKRATVCPLADIPPAEFNGAGVSVGTAGCTARCSAGRAPQHASPAAAAGLLLSLVSRQEHCFPVATWLTFSFHSDSSLDVTSPAMSPWPAYPKWHSPTHPAWYFHEHRLAPREEKELTSTL